MNAIPPFELEKVHDEEIAPLMAQIIAICQRVGLPMLATFCYAKGRDKDDPEGVYYSTTILPRDGWQSPEIMEAYAIVRKGASSRPKMLAMTITTTHEPNPNRN